MSPVRLEWCSAPRKSLLCVGLALTLAACPHPATPTDGGDDDAGVNVDAGAVAADGGAADAGMDAGTVLSGDAGPDNANAMNLAVAANPNSVLSAVATVTWTGVLASISVTVSGGPTTQSTPPAAVTNVTSPTAIPIVPLAANTTYTMVATGTNARGQSTNSNTVTFTTGAIPAEVPYFVEADGGTPSPGYTLIAKLLPNGDPNTDYLTISDSTGAPVWYTGISPELGVDFQQQPDGTFTAAVNDPPTYINGLDETLVIFHQMDVLGNTIRTWGAQDVTSGPSPVTIAGTNGHDIRLQPNGDALLFGVTEQTMNLSAYGGSSSATVVADVLERVTTEGVVSFSWNAFDYLDVANVDPVATSLTGPVIDFSHGNAIDTTIDGDYLVSLRGFSQVIKIDSSTGDVLWKLGGLDGNFTFVNDPLGKFSCQHGARQLPNGDIILFDDGDAHTPPQSRAVEYALDTTAMTATLVWSAEDDPPIYAYILGYAQRLTNGNTIITYGTDNHVQEVNPAGDVLWDLRDPNPGFGLYRAYRLSSLSPLALVSD